MLIETAIGDAYAIAWEFAPGQRGANDLATYHANPNYPEFPAGHFSDDTLRSLANAEVVLGPESGWYDPAAYVEEYQKAHTADPRLGWSKGFQAYLDEHRDSSPRTFMLKLRRRATNGALMGVAPLGYLPDETAVRMATAAQVIATHSGAAIAPAQVVSLSAHYLIHRKGTRADLRAYLEREVDWADRDEMARIIGANAVMPRAQMPAWTIAAGAFFILADPGFTGLADRLSWIVDLAKTYDCDADSLAAVTMALCSCAGDVAQNLPQALMTGLETPAKRAEISSVEEALQRFAGI